jgi:DDE superfamily endonuclease
VLQKRSVRSAAAVANHEPSLAQWATWLGPYRYGRLPMPPLRLILVWDNLAGHLSAELVLWLFAHGVLPLYTPLSGSWLNMAESVQRILVRRALAGQHPQTP